MEDKKLKKIGVAAVSASVLTAGTIAFAAAYQSGTAFDPSGSNRDLQTNQVVFSDNEDTTAHKKDGDKNESKMLEKNQNQNTQSTAKSKAQADYLFDSDKKLAENTQNSAMINNGNDNTSSGNLLDNVAQTPGSKPGTILDITGDASNADVILPGNGGISGIGTGNGTGTGGTAGENGNGNGNGGNGNNGGNGGNNNPGTIIRPADTVEDPESKKYEPPINDFFYSEQYTEDVANVPKDDLRITIEKPYDMDINCLYKGQKVDAKKIYNALQTTVFNLNNSTIYVWGETAFNNYIRIDGVSLDGGNTWITEFPVEIPKECDASQFLIKVSYRFTTKEDWKEYENVPYELEDNSLWVLTEKLSDDSKVIDSTKALVNAKRNPKLGEEINLYYSQTAYLGEEGTQLTELFPGWTENGELVPWIYSTTTPGRHILEPMDKIALSEEYKVEIKHYWLPDLCYLQTLTDYEKTSLLDPDGTGLLKKEYQEINVPKYIQAIDIDDYADLSTEYLSIPDTVINVNGSSRGIKVNQGYIVDPGNSRYAVTDNGILTNKEGTEYEAIPCKIKELSVPDNISKVNLQGRNQVSTIRIETDTAEKLPQLEFHTPEWYEMEEPQTCKIILNDNLLDNFAAENIELLKKTNNKCVASVENPDVTYTVTSEELLVGSNKELRKALGASEKTIQLDDSIDSIRGNAFSGSGVTRIVMPDDETLVDLQPNWFADSNLQTILCYSQEQYDYVYASLKKAGAERSIHVELMDKSNIQTSKEGFTYYTEVEDGKVNGILVSAPKDITNFDGTVTTQEDTPVEITKISDKAFANCKDLIWVDLPESIIQIGSSAFLNCDALQGVMINATDNIYIGDKAFDGCGSLRFIASNAMNATMQNDYNPFVGETYLNQEEAFFYCPTNSSGYGSNATNFDEASGISAYALVDIGNNNKMLYGCSSDYYYDYESEELKETLNPWLGLRSGTDMGEYVTLPSTTVEIFRYALADTKCSTGAYQLNWNELENLGYLDAGVFYNSDIGEDVELGNAVCMIGDYVFAKCSKLKNLALSEDGLLTYLGDSVFEDSKALQSVEFYDAGSNVVLGSNLFYGCDSLRRLRLFSTQEKYELLRHSDKGIFQFNMAWSQEEEAEKLKIEVPEYLETDYLKIWRYAFAGYTSGTTATDTPYLNMWKSIYNDYRREHSDWPTNEQIDELVKEKLVVSENNLRKMMNMPSVDEPTDFYPYRLSDSGELTLIGAPSNITYTFLYGDMLEFPKGWSLDYIATGAFSNSKKLESFATDENLQGIYPNAFKGVETDAFTLMFWYPSVPNLMVEKQGVPFEFGVDHSKISLIVSENMENDYIKTWSYQLAGYSDRAGMENAVSTEMVQKNGKTPTDEELKVEVDKKVLPYMNLVRGWLGLDEAGSVEEAIGETTKAAETDPTTPAEPGNMQEPNQSSENGTGDADISGRNSDKENAGDASTDSNQDNDSESDNSQNNGDISGNGTSEDKSSSGNTEQNGNVKKDESDSISQEKGTKEEN